MVAFLSLRRFRILSIIVLLSCACSVFLLQQLFHDDTRVPSQEHHELSTSCLSAAARHKMAVLVPFRDRFDELAQFLPRISHFLKQSCVAFEILVINQADEYRFNRGYLLNVGVLASCAQCDYFALHDVDLVPINPAIRYKYPQHGPLHLTPPELHPLYHYAKYLGGVLLIRREDFYLVNGMSNVFWGWGREDDEFRMRLLRAKLNLSKPKRIDSGYKTFDHLHDPKRRPRDSRLYYNQRDMTFHVDFRTGIRNTVFKSLRQYQITVNSTGKLGTATVFDVSLTCNEDLTPYCRMPKSD